LRHARRGPPSPGCFAAISANTSEAAHVLDGLISRRFA
jgi:hypothetical protein